MTKAVVDAHIEEMPSIIDMGKAGKWHRDIIKPVSWHNNRISGKLVEPTLDMIDEATSTLLPDFDPAHIEGRGFSPSLKDYQYLAAHCKLITIDDDNGVVFQNDKNYLYFPPGNYWTSSCDKNYKTTTIYDIPKYIIAPYFVQIASGIKYKIGYNYSKKLLIRGIERDSQ